MYFKTTHAFSSSDHDVAQSITFAASLKFSDMMKYMFIHN